MVFKLQTSLTLDKAEAITAFALETAGQKSFLPMTVVVLDAGGNVVLSKRQDGCGVLRLDVAYAKAWGALGMGLPTGTIGARMRDNPNFVTSLVAASKGRLAPNPGGVLILNENEEAIGAVGMSGDTGPNDEICAIAGVEASGYRAAGTE